MVARNSPNWLPFGWTVHFEVQKTGRKIRLYTNLETGQKFFSKNDVIRYIKSRSTHGEKPQPTNRHVKRHSGNNSKRLVVETIERPEWLPNGWNVELKTRNSGSRIGTKYKCYLDPLTGSKFYSKPEVFRHLKTVKRNSCTPKKRKTYISMPSGSKVVVEKHEVDDLPPGWIKEVKIKKNARGIRRDPYYTDPNSGYVFRTKKDVLRYLDTGEISKHVFKPKKRCISDEGLINSEISPSSAAKRQKLKHPATRRRLFAGKGSDKSSLQSKEAKSSKKGQCNKVYAESRGAFADTAEIVQEKQSLGSTNEDSAKTKENSNSGRSQLPKAEGSQRRIRAKRVPAENEPVLTPAAVILQEKNGLENVMENSSTRKTQINLSKSKNKKEYNLPRRSSKRLSGLEPEPVVNSVSSQRAVRVSTRKSCKSGGSTDAGLAPYSLTNGASQQPKDGVETEHAYQASTDMNIALCGEPSNKSKKPLEDLGASKKQPEILETENFYHEKPEQQDCCLFGDSSLDQCLEFAIKTLTGALPVEDTAKDGPVLTPAVEDTTKNGPVLTPAGDTLQKDNILESGTKSSSNRKAQVNPNKSKNKKDLNLSHRSSKRLAGLEPELVANSLSSEQARQNETAKSCDNETAKSLENETAKSCDNETAKSLENETAKSCDNETAKSLDNETAKSCDETAKSLENETAKSCENETAKSCENETAKSCESEAIPGVVLAGGASQQVEARTETGTAHHASTSVNTPVHGDTSNKSEKSLEVQIVPKEQLQMLETEKMPEPELPFPFGDSWSDPCLEFAFKTLTGAIPVEDSLAIQGYFQEQLDTSHTQKDGSSALPDFGLPSFFQNDISSHFDAPEKSVSGQPSPMSSSLLPPGNMSLPSCSGIGSQQPCLEGNNDLRRKVNS